MVVYMFEQDNLHKLLYLKRMFTFCKKQPIVNALNFHIKSIVNSCKKTLDTLNLGWATSWTNSLNLLKKTLVALKSWKQMLKSLDLGEI